MAKKSRERRIKVPKIDHKVIIKRAKKVENATVKHAHKFLIKRWDNVIEVRRHVIVWVVLMCSLIAATGIQLIWLQNSYSSNVLSSEGTYAEAVLGPIDTLNPLFANTSAELSTSSLLFSRLLKYDKTGNLNYDLVSKIELSDDYKVYTVSIREDVFWSDGERLDVDDIVFTINLIKDSAARTNISGWDNIDVEKLGDFEISFTLNSVYAAFEHALVFPIIPEHILGDVAPSAVRENDFSQNPVTSGPFRLNFVQNVDLSKGHKIIHMIRNDKFYNGTAKLARFQLHTYENTEEIIKALDNNEVNSAADLTPLNVKNVNQDRFSVVSSSIQSGVYALINTRSSMMSNIEVRKALRYATDVDEIISNLGVDAKNLDLPLINGQLHGDLPTVPGFDKDQAADILESDGWKLDESNKRIKKDQELVISLITIKDSEFESVLDILASQWRSVGIGVETKVIDPNDLTSNDAQDILQPRNFDVFLYQLDIGADPDVYAYWHSSQTLATGSNYSNYSNLISDAALSTARLRLDEDVRNTKYLAFVKQWVADIPAIGLYQSTAQYVFSDKVNPYAESDVLVSATDRYSNVINWSAGERTVYKTP